MKLRRRQHMAIAMEERDRQAIAAAAGEGEWEGEGGSDVRLPVDTMASLPTSSSIEGSNGEGFVAAATTTTTTTTTTTNTVCEEEKHEGKGDWERVEVSDAMDTTSPNTSTATATTVPTGVSFGGTQVWLSSAAGMGADDTHQVVGCIPSTGGLTDRGDRGDRGDKGDKGASCEDTNGSNDANHSRQAIRSIIDDSDEEGVPDVLPLHPGPLPMNLYKIGFWKSVHRIFYPISMELERQTIQKMEKEQEEEEVAEDMGKGSSGKGKVKMR